MEKAACLVSMTYAYKCALCQVVIQEAKETTFLETLLWLY